MNKEHSLFHLNFLPAERTRVAGQNIRMRELMLLGFSISLISVVMIGIFSGCYIFVRWRIIALNGELQQRQELKLAAQRELSVSSISQELKEIKIISDQIDQRTEVDSVISGVAKAVNVNTNVQIDTLNINTKKGEMRITGQAKTRDAFLSYIDALKEISGVKEVVYPPGVVFAIEPIVFDVTVQL